MVHFYFIKINNKIFKLFIKIAIYLKNIQFSNQKNFKVM